MEQGSLEWEKLRCGVFSASTTVSLCGAKGLGVSGDAYIHQKTAERITGVGEKQAFGSAIEWGHMYEPVASGVYEMVQGREIGELLKQDAFKFLDGSDRIGCSPDGIYIDKPKGVEFKCPETPAAHLKHLLLKDQSDLKKLKSGSQTGKYYWQIMQCMYVYGFKEWDFVSFHPHFTGALRMKIITVKWDQSEIDFLADRLNQAVEKSNEIESKINLLAQ